MPDDIAALYRRHILDTAALLRREKSVLALAERAPPAGAGSDRAEADGQSGLRPGGYLEELDQILQAKADMAQSMRAELHHRHALVR